MSPSGSRLAEQLSAIETMGLEELRELWREKIGAAPKLRSPQLLKLHLAWRIQADLMGGLDAEARRSLRRSGRGPKPNGLPAGSTLAREWLGVTHKVSVTDKGYTYKGKTYRSLSVIARQITGARWNGPRFFGLRKDTL